MHDSLITFLKKHNCTKFKIASGNLMCTCPFHDETRPSFGVKIDRQGKGMYNCYGCECKGSIWDLVRELESYRSNSEIRDYIDDFKSETPILKLEDLDTVVLYTLSESDYEQFAIKHEYWGMRGINEESVRKFKLGYCKERWAVTFPIRAFNTYDLIGVCFRPVDIHPSFPVELKLKMQAGLLPKYSYLQNTKPSFSLFGIEHVSLKKEVYLFEGPIDAINFMQINTGCQAIAKYGTMITRHQLSYLERFSRVNIVADNDTAGRSNAKNCSTLLRNRGVLTTVLCLDSCDKDFTDAVLNQHSTNLVQIL